ncbi:MAG: hypothetical protein PW734_02925 [Verrucomicrobium sp.]|nr:hypothetical protein [Verrucomicrobium sp.]
MTERLLLENARRALARAHLVRSARGVGAAALTASQKVVHGATIENANPALDACAEQVTLAQLLAEGATPEDRTLAALALFTDGPEPAVPCGACRQAIAAAGPEAVVVSMAEGGEPIRWLIKSLRGAV